MVQYVPFEKNLCGCGGGSPVLASLWEGPGEDLDVEVPPFQCHPPDTLLTLSAAGLKVEEAHPAVGGKGLLQNQQLSVLEDR